MENPGILYPYAKDENGNRVEAEKLTKEEASLHQYRYRGGDYVVNPIKDLIPLCPNCHAMVHYGFSLEELRRRILF